MATRADLTNLILRPITKSNLSLNWESSLGGTDLSFWDAASTFNTLNNITSTQYLREERFTAVLNQTVFTLTSYTPAAVSGNAVPIRVYRNGTRLTWVASAPSAGQFTYTGSAITTSSSALNDVVIVEYLA